MTEGEDWHWGISNAGSSDILLWLEPWADEVTIPGGATATLRIVNRTAQSSSLDVEETEEHVVIWAASGDCVEVYVDHVLQHTGSASIPVPDGFGASTKSLLGIMFGGQPKHVWLVDIRSKHLPCGGGSDCGAAFSDDILAIEPMDARP